MQHEDLGRRGVAGAVLQEHAQGVAQPGGALLVGGQRAEGVAHPRARGRQVGAQQRDRADLLEQRHRA